VARALAYLHGLPSPVAHNDLKSGNVLLSGAGNALLADFGIAKVVGGTLRNTHRRAMEGALGTAAWMAPENGDPEDPFYGKPPADIYSFAMLLYELATGRMPWEGLNIAQITAAVMRGRRPQLSEGVDAELKGLMEACWAQVPGARPAAAAVVARVVAMEWGRGGDARVAGAASRGAGCGGAGRARAASRDRAGRSCRGRRRRWWACSRAAH
jgi:serine/threonine protein kinase